MVAASWSQALGLEQMSIHENFFALGGHSLLAMQVLAHLRKVGRERESLNQLYVVDEKSRLVDSVRLRNLVTAELNTPVGELLDHQVFALRATDDQETAVAAFRKYDRTILPVLDSKDVLVGVVTVDDLNQGDRMHPNPEGVRQIVARLLPLVEKLLSETNPA